MSLLSNTMTFCDRQIWWIAFFGEDGVYRLLGTMFNWEILEKINKD
jgi:hypothetical protein